jgi:hypothetical protein
VIAFASAMMAIHNKHNRNISNSSNNAAFTNTPQQSHEFCVCSTGRSSRHLPSRSTTRGDTVGTNAVASEHTREDDGVSPAAPKVELLPRTMSFSQTSHVTNIISHTSHVTNVISHTSHVTLFLQLLHIKTLEQQVLPCDF